MAYDLDTFAQPKVELDTLPATAEPDGGQSTPDAHSGVAAVTPSARRSKRPGAGIARTTSDPHIASGDPTPFDRANNAVSTSDQLPGHDDGQGAPLQTQGSAAVVTPSEPATRAPKPKAVVRARGAAQTMPVDQTRPGGGSTISGPTRPVAFTSELLSDQGGGQCSRGAPFQDAASTQSAPAEGFLQTEEPTPDRGDAHKTPAVQCSSGVAAKSRPSKQTPSTVGALAGEGDGPSRAEDQIGNAVATIVDLWRQRCAIQRTSISVSLQAMAVCRRVVGDKEAARKEWSRIQKNPMSSDLAMVVEPYRQMVELGEKHAAGLEKQLAKMVRKLPLWTWAKDVRGLGEISVAGIIGHAAGNPGDYKSVSALWKRFGLAVIEGGRQRRVSDPQMALLHGYAPERRAFAYVVSTCLMKSQGTEGIYRQLYDRRKDYELEREIPKAHAHNRALRVMVKALLKDVWVVDRRLRAEVA